MKTVLIAAAIVIITVAGCTQKAITRTDRKDTLTENQDTKRSAADNAQQTNISGIPVESINSRNTDAAKISVRDGLFPDILFAYDSYTVDMTYKQSLMLVSGYVSKHPGIKLSVEGHCDERGTNEYNLALGDRRANAVKDYLISLGVSSRNIETVSYGEEKPACIEQTETCWSRNRRTHFVVLQEKVE